MPELVERYRSKIPEIIKILKKSYFSPAHPSPLTDTPTNWTTIATGSWMGTHGITGFGAHLKGMELGEATETLNSNLCQSEYIWQAAERQGKKSILINYPISFPVTLKDGIVVGGDGHLSKEWTVRWPDYISTKLRKTKEEKISYFETEIKIELKKPASWENIPNGIKIIKEAKATFYQEVCSFDWGAAGLRKAKYEEKKDSLKKEYRFILVIKEDGKLKVIISPERNYKKAVAILSKGEKSGWVKEKFFGIECLRQYKVLELGRDGKEVTIYGTIAGKLKGWGHPKGIEKELIKKCGGYVEALEISHTEPLSNNRFGEEIYYDVLGLQIDCLDKYTQYLSKTRDWDLMFVQLHSPDGLNHTNLRNLEEKKNSIIYRTTNSLFLNTAKRLFKLANSIIKKCADENTIVCIVSDHGNSPVREYVNSHGLMERIGLSQFYRDKTSGSWNLDVKKSKAVYSNEHSGIWINLKGREKYGCVKPGKEYEDLRDKIINSFRKMVNPKTKEPVFELVGRREAFESLGMSGERIPDVVCFARPYYLFAEGNCFDISNKIMELYRNADSLIPLDEAAKVKIIGSSTSVHRFLPNAKLSYCSNRGVFIIGGKGIKKNKNGRPVNLVDITPTISYILGIKPPEQSEGKIILDIFE